MDKRVITIDPATPADRDSLHALIESAYRGDSARRGWTHEADLLGGQRTDPEALADLLADPAQTMLVARDGQRLCGCIALADKGRDRFYFGMLTVDPRMQGAGLGKQLLDAAEDFARQQGAKVMEMQVIAQRTDLIAWYERRGYRATGGTAPFPMHDPRFGLPKRDDLVFALFEKPL
ncbi:ribosomal protein S18 acetylase RimI-like enzyme [Sphingomicrobium lutaoense]|uniref:Ribosomal protein S18 acetylase RimI-like enzyme n=1 Tax=Sphingomicrobium lutaoense TaxID=515949 RepID=A0A839Z0S6_9SPHN|nr:GNAT family N-acetyltransferase [Sphingomicrobium lutaoense]MBB3764866.1 ribosomal protein S18 acetylase RimI-like enzyme [Sphingomicrobium lutaoense]